MRKRWGVTNITYILAPGILHINTYVLRICLFLDFNVLLKGEILTLISIYINYNCSSLSSPVSYNEEKAETEYLGDLACKRGDTK